MDKSHPPTTFGIFKPVDHTLIAFDSAADLRAARQALNALGFSAASMVEYDPREMLALSEAELATASPIAVFGYEVRLLRQHRQLALRGCSFLVVHVPGERAADSLAQWVRDWQPVTAQHYGRFLIEDLTERRPGLPAT